MRRYILFLTATLAAIGWGGVVGGQAVGGGVAGGGATLKIRESITPPDGFISIGGLADLDGDKTLDLVVYKGNQNGGFKVLERAADGTWQERFTYQSPNCRSVCVADTDGDGRPEVAVAEHSAVVIHEAADDNKYIITHKSTGYGSKIEKIVAGDTDGNGRNEFLVAREGSQIHALKSTADNTYRFLPTMKGGNGDCHVVGAMDLDGDGIPSVVFQDSERFGGTVAHTYVFKKGKRVFDVAKFGVLGVGDTDGNGRREMIGGTNLGQHTDDLLIYECLGNSQFKQVVNLPKWWEKTTRLDILDVDGDGRTELLRRLPGPGGVNNVLSVSTRDGDEIKEVYNSGKLFTEQDAVIGRLVPTGDTNQDGHREFLVHQGGKLLVVEIERGWKMPRPGSVVDPGSGSGPGE